MKALTAAIGRCSVVVVLVAGVFAAGGGSIGPAGAAGAAGAAGPETAPPPPSATPCEIRAGVGAYPNPLNECAAADPGMVIQGDTWYAFTTGLHLYRSSDAGHHWDDLGKFLTAPAGYVDTWAPEVYRVGDAWICYFSMRTAPGQYERIYTATSQWLDRGWVLDPTPIYQTADHSTIDATMFQAPYGRRYLIWKDDYQTKEQRQISIAPLSTDARRVTGAPTPIMHVTEAWEGNSVEAPSMLYRASTRRYYLFYSGNLYTYTGNYAVGVASASSPLGDFDAGKRGAPILQGNDRYASPGHQFIASVHIHGRPTQLLFYHAYQWYDAAGNKLESPQTRKLMMDPLTWNADGWPSVGDGFPSQ